jgi:hypothetical protein
VDARQREFERRGVGGDVEAAARDLRARVRSGSLNAERLRLAAHLGNEPARIALGPDAPARELELRRWVGGLDDYEAATRVLLALGWLVLPSWEEVFPVSAGPRSALVAAEDALGTGESGGDLMAATAGAATVIAVVRQAALAMVRAADAGVSPLTDPAGAAAWAVENAGLGGVLTTLGLSLAEFSVAFRRECGGAQGEGSVQAVVASTFQRPSSALHMAALSCSEVQTFLTARRRHANAIRALREAGDCARRISRQVGSQPVRDAIRDALVPWALG